MAFTYIFADSFLGKVFQQLQFSESTKGEHCMVKRGDLLDGDFGSRWSVHGGDDHSVGSFAYHIDDLVRITCDQCSEGRMNSPTLNLTFRGAEALEPFVVLS